VESVDVKKGTKGARLFRLLAVPGPDAGLTPTDLATAYALNTTGGSGQTVGIVDWNNDPNIASDLNYFDSYYGLQSCQSGAVGLPTTCLSVVNQTGGLLLQSGGSAPAPSNDPNAGVEESMDVEAVHSVCQACKIILVESKSSNVVSVMNADLAAAENEVVTLGATEVSNSWAAPETNSNAVLQAAFNHPGVVITASAGDNGYYDYDALVPGGTNMPNEPAAYPTVVAVGGTSLRLNANATRQSETVWNGNSPMDPLHTHGASGGGCSTLFSAQAWQTYPTFLSTWTSTGCGTKRLVADVSADADPNTGFDVYDTFGPVFVPPYTLTVNWMRLGGTSLASPIIAAIYALAGGAHGVPYPALTLYGHLGSASLYDVTAGGSGWCDGLHQSACPNPNAQGYGLLDCAYPAPAYGACDASGGYDGPSGVGTPNGLGAFATTGLTTIVGGPGHQSATGPWIATTTDPYITSYSWNWGDGHTTVTSSPVGSHFYIPAFGVARHYLITLTVTDKYGMTGTSAPLPVTVNPSP
jgi:hypothetical protein